MLMKDIILLVIISPQNYIYKFIVQVLKDNTVKPGPKDIVGLRYNDFLLQFSAIAATEHLFVFIYFLVT